MMKRSEGFVLVTVLLVMVVVGILALGASFTSLIDRQVSANQRGASAAYYVAEAGIQYYKTWIFNNLVDYYESEGEGWCDIPSGRQQKSE
jgi:Tfp pilus assembly protein PilX